MLAVFRKDLRLFFRDRFALVFSLLMPIFVITVIAEPTVMTVTGVLTSSGVNDAPSARQTIEAVPAVAKGDPSRSSVLWVRPAMAATASCTGAAARVPMTLTEVPVVAAPPTAMRVQSIIA